MLVYNELAHIYTEETSFSFKIMHLLSEPKIGKPFITFSQKTVENRKITESQVRKVSLK